MNIVAQAPRAQVLQHIRPFTEAAARGVMNVFETMLGLQVVRTLDVSYPPESKRVCGCIGIAGEQVAGAVYLHVAEPFAAAITSVFLGKIPDVLPHESDVNDCLGEFCNMIAGRAKAIICEAGLPCSVSTPAVLRGEHFEIKSKPNIQREVLAFEWEQQKTILEVHLKTCIE